MRTIPCWSALVLAVLISWVGCAAQPVTSNPLVGAQAGAVRFLHAPPPNAKFIAKIVYSGAPEDNWQSNCVRYLSAKALKLGGNVVVPGVELDFGTHQLYGDELHGPPPNLVIRNEINGRDPYGYPQMGGNVVVPSRFHFWSNVYFCPE